MRIHDDGVKSAPIMIMLGFIIEIVAIMKRPKDSGESTK